MNTAAFTQPSFTPRRKWQIAAHVLASIAALLLSITFINILSSHHFYRLQLSQQSRHQLSPMTLNLLKNLTNDIKAVVFFDRREALYNPVSEMIKQYHAACPKLQIDYVDYILYPSRAEVVQNEYKLAVGQKDRVIFRGNGQTVVVNSAELSDYDYSGLLTGKEIKRTNFKGEQLFTSALYRIANPRTNTVCFLQGHGENDPADGDNQQGFLNFAKMLQESNIRVQNLSLIKNDVPVDCQLLVIAAPAHPLLAEEQERIEKYLSQGGRLLALFNYASASVDLGLERILARYGIQVGHNIVYDAQESQSGVSQLLLVSAFGEHPVVKPLLRSRLGMVFPRSISKAAPTMAGDSAKAAELAYSSPSSSATVLNRKGETVKERDGPIPLAAAAEKGGIQGVSADVGATRIIAVGDSLCFGNVLLDTEANRDFATLAVNWLLNRDVLLQGIGPSPVVEYQLTMTQSQMSNLRWLLLVILPSGSVVLGFLIWFRRRA